MKKVIYEHTTQVFLGHAPLNKGEIKKYEGLKRGGWVNPLIAALVAQARKTIYEAYMDKTIDTEAERALSILADRLFEAKDEDIFAIFHAFCSPYLNIIRGEQVDLVDFTNHRLVGSYREVQKHRRSAVRKGRSFKGIRRRNAQEIRKAAWEALDEPSLIGALTRDKYFPSTLTDEEIDRYAKRGDIDIDVEEWEGQPAVQLSAGPKGAWAVYVLNDAGDYTRVFVERAWKLQSTAYQHLLEEVSDVQ